MNRATERILALRGMSVSLGPWRVIGFTFTCLLILLSVSLYLDNKSITNFTTSTDTAAGAFDRIREMSNEAVDPTVDMDDEAREMASDAAEGAAEMASGTINWDSEVGEIASDGIETADNDDLAGSAGTFDEVWDDSNNQDFEHNDYPVAASPTAKQLSRQAIIDKLLSEERPGDGVRIFAMLVSAFCLCVSFLLLTITLPVYIWSNNSRRSLRAGKLVKSAFGFIVASGGGVIATLGFV